MRRRRALLLAGFWLLQAVIIYVGWPAVIDPRFLLSRTAEWADMLGDGEYIAITIAVIVSLTAMQAAFVRPVHAPTRRKPGLDPTKSLFCDACGYFLSNLASAVAIAFVSATAITFAAGIIGGWDVLEFSTSIPELRHVIFFGTLIGGAIVLTPLLMWRCRETTPVWISLVIAVFAITGLFTACVLTLLSAAELIRGSELPDQTRRVICALPVVVGWMIATPLLIAFMRRGPRDSRLARLASLIFLGTVIETVAVLPIDFVIRKRTNCYCEQGTFWALMILGSVGAFALGPAVYLLPIGRRRRRWLLGRCEVCGYDMAATPKAERCPECGAGWRPNDSSVADPTTDN